MRPGWRLTTLGVVFAALFSILALRLWLIQVTEAAAAEQQVERQQVRIVESPAARGEILDRNGVLLAGTRASLSAVIDGSLLPVEREDEVIQALAGLLELPAVEVRARVNEARRYEGSTRVRSDLTEAQALFLVEHAEDFPGVRVEPLPVRTYPHGPLAAHVLGYIGRPSDADLELPGVTAADNVGKFGVEKVYDVWLRGSPGLVKYRVNSQQEILSVAGEQEALPGGTVITTIDSEHQHVLEEALAEGMLLSLREGEAPKRASGVVLDVRTGAVVAMASVPSFDPNIFIDGLSQREWDELQEVGAFNNFSIQGNYAPASTFKVVAYSLAMEKGVYPQADQAAAPLSNHDQGYFCSGRLEFQFQDGSPNVYNDWTPLGHGVVDLHGALEASCDLYFWELALRVWRDRDSFDEAEIQRWSEQLGFGAVTGIDLPFEQAGLVPDREWFETTQRETPGRVRAEGAWSGGDVMNLTIGQGALTATPIQLANAYAALVNGGALWRPYVVDRVLNRDGATVFENPPSALRDLDLDPDTVTWLRRDLKSVVSGGRGTARGDFAGVGPRITEVGGKTGTAEVRKGSTPEDDIDTAWFVGVTNIDDPEYVVAVVIEEGGSGGRIAAPTARKVIESLLGMEPGAVTAGEETD